MIQKLTREGRSLCTFPTEEEAAKDASVTLALFRSHINAKKPKYLGGVVYAVIAHQEVIELPVPEGGGCKGFKVITTVGEISPDDIGNGQIKVPWEVTPEELNKGGQFREVPGDEVFPTETVPRGTSEVVQADIDEVVKAWEDNPREEPSVIMDERGEEITPDQLADLLLTPIQRRRKHGVPPSAE